METDGHETRRNTGEPGLAAKPAKARYLKPVLHVYGSVSKLTMGGGGTKADGATKDKVTSDRRAKENVVRIGDHPLGIGLYLFEYKPEYRRKCGAGRRFGVMADEVEEVMPQAVSLHPDGYKLVDYRMLGLDVRSDSAH